MPGLVAAGAVDVEGHAHASGAGDGMGLSVAGRIKAPGVDGARGLQQSIASSTHEPPLSLTN
ncbi:MAG: hypothetical protein ACRD04_09545 [Terriglobales bacterium]